MSTVVIELQNATVEDVEVTEDTLTVEFSDGRILVVPLAWYPRLYHGTPSERKSWRMFWQGVGIHWPELDEDLSVEGLLLGKKSTESQASLARWLGKRGALHPMVAYGLIKPLPARIDQSFLHPRVTSECVSLRLEI